MPHRVLAQQRQPFHPQLPVNQRHPVGVHAKAAALLRNIVGDNQVQILAPHLVGGVGLQIFALRRKPHADEIAGGRSQNVYSLVQMYCHLIGGRLFDFLPGGDRWPVVGHRGGHNQGVGARCGRQHGRAHILRRAHLDHLRQRRVGQRHRRRNQRHRRPPVPGRLGHREPHAPRRVVGNHPHRVDGFLRPPGADHHPPAGQVAILPQGGGDVAQQFRRLDQPASSRQP